MSHNTLEAYYRVIFAMVHHHKWQLEALEDLVPFELDLYIAMVKAHQESQNG